MTVGILTKRLAEDGVMWLSWYSTIEGAQPRHLQRSSPSRRPFFSNAERRTKELMRGRQRGFVAFGRFSLTKIVDGTIVVAAFRARECLLWSNLDCADFYSRVERGSSSWTM